MIVILFRYVVVVFTAIEVYPKDINDVIEYPLPTYFILSSTITTLQYNYPTVPSLLQSISYNVLIIFPLLSHLMITPTTNQHSQSPSYPTQPRLHPYSIIIITHFSYYHSLIILSKYQLILYVNYYSALIVVHLLIYYFNYFLYFIFALFSVV